MIFIGAAFRASSFICDFSPIHALFKPSLGPSSTPGLFFPQALRETGISQNGSLWNQGEVFMTAAGLIRYGRMTQLAADAAKGLASSYPEKGHVTWIFTPGILLK
jgi:hypothetical protein